MVFLFQKKPDMYGYYERRKMFHQFRKPNCCSFSSFNRHSDAAIALMICISDMIYLQSFTRLQLFHSTPWSGLQVKWPHGLFFTGIDC